MNTHHRDIFDRLIAIVSQNQTLASILKEQCLLYGFQFVEIIQDWPGLFDAFTRRMPDIIVSDRLPNINERLRQNPPASQLSSCLPPVPVVLYGQAQKSSWEMFPEELRLIASLCGREEQQRLLEVIHTELETPSGASGDMLQHNHLNILIASADHELQIKLRQILQEGQHHIIVKDRGKEIMLCVQKHLPNIVFLDEGVAHFNNISFIYWIKDVSPGTYIILMGSKLSPKIISELNRSSIYNYLVKPFDLNIIPVLCDRIRHNIITLQKSVSTSEKRDTDSLKFEELRLLKESEENFKTLINASGDLIFRITPQGLLNFASPAVEEQLGYTREDLEAQRVNVGKFVHPQDLIRVMAGIRKVIQGSSIQGLECRLMHQNKTEYRWYSINCYPMYNTRKKFVGVGGIARDISSIKAFEKRTRKQNERLSALNTIARIVNQSLNLDDILQNVVDKILEIMRLEAGSFYVLEPDKKQFLLKSCRTFESKNDTLESDLLDLYEIHEELGKKGGFETDGPHVIENIAEHSQYSRTRLLDLHFHTFISIPLKSKDIVLGVMVLLSKRPRLLSEGDLQLLLSIANQVSMTIENITLYEQELAARKRLEELNKLKDDFVAIVSHDLRSPLTAILGAAEILLSDEYFEQPLSQEQRDLVRDVQAMGNQQLQLVNDLLDVAKIESGKFEIKPTLVDIQDVVQQCYKTLRMLANNKNINLIFLAAPNLPRMRIDVPKISQVINNLVGNAIKFTQPDGKVTIRLTGTEDNMIQVAVTDTGEGIRPEHLSLLFNKFQQIRNHGTRGERGTGLGLAICKNLVELHEGRIWAESRVGIGSTFAFTLPITETVIVIIDDSLFVVKSLRNILSEHLPNVSIKYALNGDDGVKLVEEVLPAAVILDYVMPDVDGIAVFQELRSRMGNKVPPTIFLTASQDLDVRRRIFELGAADYLQKPVDVNDLLPRLSRFL